MKAVVITTPGGPEVLRLQDTPAPEPGPDQVLVRVHAAGVNRADLLQRRGLYPAPPGAPADIPGLEYAGVVESVGANVTTQHTGDEVMGLVGGGAYAEYVCAHAHETIPVPNGIALVDAAAIPEAFITAHDALFTQSQLRAGETVLIHAVGSGVGTAAVQLAHAAGARVIGTARTAAKLERAQALGMDIGVVAEGGRFADALELRCGKTPVDVVLELVGGDYVQDDLAVLAQHGRLSLVGLMAGASTVVDLGAILRKRITVRGTVMRARALEEKIVTARAFESFARPLFESGALRPLVDRVFHLEDAAAAHAYVERNENFGKVLLQIRA